MATKTRSESRARKPVNGQFVTKPFIPSYVYDGDTVDGEILSTSHMGFIKHHHKVCVRLWPIDTPERGQRLYTEAGDRLRELMSAKKILLAYVTDGEVMWTGFHGRILGMLFVKKVFSTKDVQEILLKEGLARMYRKPDLLSPELLAHYQSIEERAEDKRVGLWQPRRARHPGIGVFILGVIIGAIILFCVLLLA